MASGYPKSSHQLTLSCKEQLADPGCQTGVCAHYIIIIIIIIIIVTVILFHNFSIKCLKLLTHVNKTKINAAIN